MAENNVTYAYGYNATAVNQLIADVNSIVYAGGGEGDTSSAAGLAISGVDDIKAVCDANWDGKSKDNFIINLRADAQKFANALQQLQNAFNAEIRNAAADFKSFDENLITTDGQ